MCCRRVRAQQFEKNPAQVKGRVEQDLERGRQSRGIRRRRLGGDSGDGVGVFFVAVGGSRGVGDGMFVGVFGG